LTRRPVGFSVWFTGLSGSGKSTTARLLAQSLILLGRTVTVLDGDAVRTHLSAGLGFSKEDRDANVRRIGFVASEIVRHGGVVICAAISPYRKAREECRTMIGADRFVEVFVDTPLVVCERRDPKGLYARARRGEITHFTGLDDPYERPIDPDLTLDTITHTAEENARAILSQLARMGFAIDDSAHRAASSSL
jgi:sulfate adenylyltransferase